MSVCVLTHLQKNCSIGRLLKAVIDGENYIMKTELEFYANAKTGVNAGIISSFK